ncbi:hypothetical protein BOTBODRAFT_300218 [Botryobasidium botryosum FD-172 SS1]|uniref:FAD-binding domain-containing protein n=1 Tax=Botryobasidium botryosum (strain FD-172 SS1) TaxID=930990 RepID=A0A067MGT9_BOTB1|nr:hypothetical protein BOTBODRAFT_300218 [Botryobasidium botryosum FD-172 SS1]
MSAAVPQKTQVLVIGGGPGGSYAASALVREGHEVVLLESAKFPRYHIGESMLPSMRHFLRFIDLEDEFEAHGFAIKPGAAAKFTAHKKEGYTDFVEKGQTKGTWNVIRSEADEIMLRYAGRQGANIIEETKVTSINFAGDPAESRPISAEWKNVQGQTGTIEFEWLVDASGRDGIMSTKYLKNRRFNEAFKNVAFWGYYTGTGKYEPGTHRENAPFFEALNDESGWAWFIPLHNGTTSVGVVMNQEVYTQKRKSEKATRPSLQEHYEGQLAEWAPTIMRLIGEGKIKTNVEGPTVKMASDYSYNAPSYAGDHYRIAGDAGAFIDPFFSSGVHLAILGALAAATSICAEIRGQCKSADAEKWHTDKINVSYTRWLLVVMSAYKQMRASNEPVLADVDEESFDRAFDFFRPIIQGSSDYGKSLTRDELNKAIDFCGAIFHEFKPEDIDAAVERAGPAVLEGNAIPGAAPAAVDPEDEKAQEVLKLLSASKHVMTKEQDHGLHVFGADAVNGLKVILERGNLGLYRVDSE